MEVSKLLLSMFMLVSFSFINAGDRCHDKEWLKDPANITEEQWKEIYARDCARRSDK